MKKMMLIFLMAMLSGCSYGENGFQDVVDDPAMLLKDPHFAQYQEQLDNLEHAYLRKEITYAQYVEEKKRLEDPYEGEVQHRQDVIEDK